MANVTVLAESDAIIQTTSLKYTVTAQDVSNTAILLTVPWPRPFKDTNYIASYSLTDITRLAYGLTSLAGKFAGAIVLLIGISAATGLAAGDQLEIDAIGFSSTGNNNVT